MSFGPRIAMEISTGTLARFLLLVLGIIFLYIIRDIALIILASIVIASSVEPLVKKFVRYRIPRVIASLLIYLVGIIGFIATFYALLPPLLSDFNSFISTFPELIESVFLRLQDYVVFVPLESAIPHIQDIASWPDFSLSDAVAGFFSTTSSLFSGLFSFVLVLVISFYLSVQDDGIGNVLRILTPSEYEDYIIGLWKRSEQKIGRWLQGQLLLGLIVGVLVFIALTVLRVRFAFSLAVLSALLELIPYFGPIIAAIPGVAVAAMQDPLLGALVLIVYIVVQQMENHLIYPQVVRKTVGVPPLLAIIALLIGGKLAGIIGIIVAIPVAVVLVEYLNDVVDRKKKLAV